MGERVIEWESEGGREGGGLMVLWLYGSIVIGLCDERD